MTAIARSPLGQAALSYAHLAPVFPLKPREKKPLTKNGFKDASADPEQIAAWWAQWPDANIGIPTGAVVGWDVLDVDEKSGGLETLARLEKEHGPIPETAYQLTGSGGLHYLFKHQPGFKNAVELAPGLDLRTTGGYIVVAPSIHPNGQPYAWDLEHDLEDVAPADWPDWLLAMLPVKEEPAPATFSSNGTAPADDDPVKAYALKALEDECRIVAQAPVGRQEATLNTASLKIGGLVAAGALDYEAAGRALCLAALKMVNDPERSPWTEAQIVSKVSRGFRKATPRDLSGIGNGAFEAMGFTADDFKPTPGNLKPLPFGPRRFALTEFGNRERFVHRWGQHVRHCSPLGGWLVWTGACWALDEGGKVKEWAVETTRAIGAEEKGKYLSSDKIPIDLGDRWSRQSQTAQKIKNMLELASHHHQVSMAVGRFDAEPMLFNCKNGTVDLTNGAFYPADREDYLTQVAPVQYDRAAACPRWEAFMASTFPQHPEIVPFLQRYLGHCLTGNAQEQKFVIFHGGGGNGKTTLFETISKLMGPYATAVNPSVFGDQPTGQAQKEYQLAMLRPCRFVVTAEAEQRRQLDEALVKRTTGGDRLVARNPHERPFTFYPEFKIILSTNHRPEVRGRDTGIWRRLVLVPFAIKFGEDGFPQKIPDLQERLTEEWPGILNWLIRGCLEWQRDGLQIPDCVQAATQAYKEEEDILGDFFEECCVFGGGRQVLKRDLYRAYEKWSVGLPMRERTFNREIGERADEHGFRAGRNMVSTTWEGLGLSEKGQSKLNDHSLPWQQN